MREIRTIKYPLKTSNIVEKKENRDFFDCRLNDYVSIVQWKNSKVIYIDSSFSNIEPTKLV